MRLYMAPTFSQKGELHEETGQQKAGFVRRTGRLHQKRVMRF
jgi:hypothetical protein